MNNLNLSEEQKHIRDIILASNKFDADYYKNVCQDAMASGLDPLDHYIMFGAKENRDPAVWFVNAYYLEKNPDVKASGMNPFFHYLSHGFKEYRFTNPDTTKLAQLAKQAEEFQCRHEFGKAAKIYEEIIEINNNSFDGAPFFAWLPALGECYMQIGKWAEAERIFRKAGELYHDDANIHACMAKVLQRQAKWWQASHEWEKAIKLDDGNAEWWAEKGKTDECMKHWEVAAVDYENAIKIDDRWTEWHYRLGYVREQCGRAILAEEAYREAILRDKNLDAAKFGIGVFHAQRDRWDEAVKAYEQAIRLNYNLDSPEFQEKLALAYYRKYDFEKACAANLNVLFQCAKQEKSSMKLRGDAFYRLGVALERMKDFEKAAIAYSDSLKIKFDSYRCYRLGYALASVGEYKEACAAYLRINKFGSVQPENPGDPYTRLFASDNIRQCRLRLANDATRLEDYLLLGFWLERINDLDGAIQAYRDGAARLNEHAPGVWFNLGRVLALNQHFKEACSAFANLEILREPYFVDRKYYEKNLWFKRKVDYTEYCRHLPVSENVILYESMHGVGVGDNPYAIFLEMLHHPVYKNWVHVWSLASMDYIPYELKALPNVIFILRNSDGFLRYLATAKVLIHNVTWPPYFIRREGQIYLNTWHGTPMKTLGRAIKDDPYATNNTTRNFLQATHLIHSNEFTEEILLSCFSVKSLCQGYSAVSGYPRIDLSLRMTDEEKLALRQKLGIPPNKKVLLYAPTWRGTEIAENEVEDSPEFIETALAVCSKLQNCVTIFRGHQGYERFGKHFPSCLVAMQAIPTNTLLAITDILITDYSSIAFDFMALKRPIIYFCPDIARYRVERGFYIEPRNLPGYYCETAEELSRLTKDIANTDIRIIDQAAIDKYCPMDDGKASLRVIAKLFDTNDINVLNDKKNILIYIDFLKNGIGMSALALCEVLIRENKYNLYIMVNRELINNSPEVREMLKQLPKGCNLIVGIRSMNMTIEEYALKNRYDSQKKFYNERDRHLYSEMYKREFTRVFGTTRFDALIDFTGYAAYQVDLFAFAENQGTKLIWLHSDMLQEMHTRFPYFEQIFQRYKYFDKCVSVSAGICQTNRDNLAEQYDIPKEKFVCCPNLQRPDAVRKAAKVALNEEDIPLFRDNYKIFVNLARLSPEKNQIMLIEAFARVHKTHPDTRLLLVGKGPSEKDLREAIVELNLNQSVYLTGFRDNPYPLVANSDCVVLPSLYEGAPLTLFEAMALSKPIIASDIPAHREILGSNKYGLLAENTVNGLATVMESFLFGKIQSQPFDFDAYNARSMASFDHLLQ